VPPLANGTSQPSIFNVAKNVRLLGHTACVDVEALEPVRDHFMAVARQHDFPIGRPLEYDHGQYLYQVPGGMISNMRHQLKIAGVESKFDQVLEEAIRVRAEFGYPIMVTPLSQYVCAQATINVIVGERYKQVIDQVIQYALGLWGQEATRVMDPDVRDKILSHPRAKDWEGWTPPQPSLAEVRRKFPAGISDEELILRVFAGDEAVNALATAAKPAPALNGTDPLLKLIQNLGTSERRGYVHISRPGFSLKLERRSN
jgi:oxaloacetate decarboxylase alpha subunit